MLALCQMHSSKHFVCINSFNSLATRQIGHLQDPSSFFPSLPHLLFLRNMKSLLCSGERERESVHSDTDREIYSLSGKRNGLKL